MVASRPDLCLLDLRRRHRKGQLPVTLPMVISTPRCGRRPGEKGCALGIVPEGLAPAPGRIVVRASV